MFGLDEWVAGLGQAHPLLLATIIAALLGLRHATDPDHLSAVTTLVVSHGERPWDATRLGLAWGAGHGTTLVAFGVPIVLASSYLPELVLQVAEAAVGFVIVGLALRLLVQWRQGRVHGHEHGSRASRQSRDADDRSGCARTAFGAYAIGVMHGLGGSAGVGVLLLASIEDKLLASVALVVFASLTALSMAVCSGTLGVFLSTNVAARRLQDVAPALGVAGAAFGVWYVAAAVHLAPYPF